MDCDKCSRSSTGGRVFGVLSKFECGSLDTVKGHLACTIRTLSSCMRPAPSPCFPCPNTKQVHEECIVCDLVCYGLGCIESSRVSRAQLALALLLHDMLQISGEMLLYEPLLSACGKAAAQRLGIHIIDQNEEGARRVCKRTVFFMPHCARQLYCNLLRANWGPSLPLLVVIGNSFSAYDMRSVSILGNSADKRLEDPLFAILPYTVEFPCIGAFSDGAAFNDLSIHCFPSSRMRRTADWSDPCPHLAPTKANVGSVTAHLPLLSESSVTKRGEIQPEQCAACEFWETISIDKWEANGSILLS